MFINKLVPILKLIESRETSIRETIGQSRDWAQSSRVQHRWHSIIDHQASMYQPKPSKPYIWALGGSGRTNDLELYDPDAGTWNQAKAANVKGAVLGVVCLNNRVYTIGVDEWGSNNGCFDPETNVWIRIANRTIEHDRFGLCTLNGQIYSVGGAGNVE